MIVINKIHNQEELKMLSMKEAIENYVEGCVGKVDCPAYKLFMKAILAGMMIAFGAAGSSGST